MKKTKKIQKEEVIKTLIAFVAIFFVVFFLLLVVWSKLLSYGYCQDILFLLYLAIASVCSALMGAIIYFIVIKTIKTENKLKISIFFRKNYPFFADGFYIIIFLLFAINGKLFFDYEKAKDLLTIDWMIFAISVAIFLVWEKTVLAYLKDKKPKKNDVTDNPIEKLSAIQQKVNFSGQANMFFNSVFLISINTLSLVIATGMLFISPEDTIPLFVLNILLFALIVTTNTIISLLFDLVRVLIMKKRELLAGTQVSLKETEEVYNELYIKVMLGAILKAIEDDDTKTEEEKEECINELQQVLINMVKESKEKSDCGNNEEKNKNMSKS